MNITKNIKRLIHYVKKSSVWVKLIILCIILLTLIHLIQSMANRIEPFNGNHPKYEMKQHNLYDDFYSDIYDELVYSPKKNEYEISNILKKISLPQKSNILDIGSGTGHHVNLFNKRLAVINSFFVLFASTKYCLILPLLVLCSVPSI